MGRIVNRCIIKEDKVLIGGSTPYIEPGDASPTDVTPGSVSTALRISASPKTTGIWRIVLMFSLSTPICRRPVFEFFSDVIVTALSPGINCSISIFSFPSDIKRYDEPFLSYRYLKYAKHGGPSGSVSEKYPNWSVLTPIGGLSRETVAPTIVSPVFASLI